MLHLDFCSVWLVAVWTFHGAVICAAWAPLHRFDVTGTTKESLSSPTRLLSPTCASQRYAVSSTSTTRLQVHLDREADLLEQLMGGERYEMNELPDSMMDTTVFVGNLNEFVQDEDLSMLFQTVSSLQTLPACVVRKPDMSSLEYGFVSFPSVQEKEAAIIRFHGVEFKGRRLKVEAVKDTPGIRRVRIPEKMIAYVSGTKKSVGSHSNAIHQNSLRRVSSSRDNEASTKKAAASKRKGNRKNVITAPTTSIRLNDKERAEFERATKKGFVTVLAGNGSRRGNGPLATVFRQWCDARSKPQICVYKATGGSRPLDQVVVDLSPLRLYGLFDDAVQVEDYMVRWKAEILTAASGNSMQLCGQMDEFDDDDDDADIELCKTVTTDMVTTDMECVILEVNSATRDAWATKPIGQLPSLALVFQGERCNAKAMAKDLALLWEVPEKVEAGGELQSNQNKAGEKRRAKNKTKGLSQYRRRGGGHRQAWD